MQSTTFCRQHEILTCVIKVVDEKIRKNCCQQQKVIDDNTKYVLVSVC